MDLNINDNQYTILGIIIGGIGLKAVEYMFKKREDKENRIAELEKQLEDKDLSIRSELRDDLKEIRAQLQKVEEDNNEWRQKYWDKVAELNNLQLENARLLANMVKAQQEANDLAKDNQ